MGAVIHAPDREKNTLSRDVRIIIIRKIRCILEICKDVLFLGIMQIFYIYILFNDKAAAVCPRASEEIMFFYEYTIRVEFLVMRHGCVNDNTKTAYSIDTSQRSFYDCTSKCLC